MTERPWSIHDDAGHTSVDDPCQCMVTVSDAGARYMTAIAFMLAGYLIDTAEVTGGDSAVARINGVRCKIHLTWTAQPITQEDMTSAN